MKKLIYTLISLSLVTGSALAKKPNRKPGKNNKKDRSEKAAILEEKILDQKDSHGAHVEAGKDKRPTSFNEYHKRTYSRIKALLTAGKITEKQGLAYKESHTVATKALAVAKADGSLTTKEVATHRASLDKINDEITAVAGNGEEDKERTPLLNRTQHKMEESIESGIKSGRLSTLEANGLKRKLERLVSLEDRLKKDKEISKTEREKLFKEVGEIRRDMKKALFD